MNKKLNILFIASWYPTPYMPFNGDFIQRHAKAVALFCNVTVVHIASAQQNTRFVIEDKLNENVREVRIFHRKVKSRIGIIKNFKNLVIKYRAFKIAFNRVQKHEAIDIVHLNVLFPAGIFALFLKIRYNLPYIITEHWTRFLNGMREPFTFYELLIIKRIMKSASLICPVSEDLKNNLKKIAPQAAYQVVPNVVDTTLFYLLSKKNKTEQIKFIHVSSLNDEAKNIKGMLRAIKIASKYELNFIVNFVGNDNIKNYADYADELEIPEHILKFTGEVSYSEVSNLMRSHHVLLMFSNYENAPCVISEALVSGLPVISSDVGGISEMIDETNGYLVERKDEQGLAKKIVKMLKYYHLFDNELIAKQAKQKYSYQTVGKQYFELYKRVLQE